MRKIIFTALGVVAVIVVAAGLLLTSRIRAVSADLAQRLQTETGTDLTSSGLPGISFWPRFAVSFGNVVIPAPKGAPSTLATIETVRVIPADGLFGLGENGIAEIVLEQPSINLVVGSDGGANWNYGAKTHEGEDGLPLRIVDGRIAYLDERTGAALALSNVDATATLAGFADEMNARRLPGVHFRPAVFEPTFQKHAGQTCGGCQIHVLDRHAFLPVESAVALLIAIRAQNPAKFEWRQPPYEYEHEKLPIDILAGSRALRQQIEAGMPARAIADSWQSGIHEFAKARQPYLLY